MNSLVVDILQKGYHRKQQFSPLCLHSCGIVSGTGDPIPGTVWISSEAAVCTGGAIHVTLVELHLRYDWLRSNVELLLEKNTPCTIKFLELPLKLLLPMELLKALVSLASCASSLCPEGGRVTLWENTWLQTKLSCMRTKERKKVNWRSLFWHFLTSEVSALYTLCLNRQGFKFLFSSSR